MASAFFCSRNFLGTQIIFPTSGSRYWCQNNRRANNSIPKRETLNQPGRWGSNCSIPENGLKSHGMGAMLSNSSPSPSSAFVHPLRNVFTPWASNMMCGEVIPMKVKSSNAVTCTWTRGTLGFRKSPRTCGQVRDRKKALKSDDSCTDGIEMPTGGRGMAGRDGEAYSDEKLEWVKVTGTTSALNDRGIWNSYFWIKCVQANQTYINVNRVSGDK